MSIQFICYEEHMNSRYGVQSACRTRLRAQELKEAHTEKLQKGVFNEVKHMVLVQKVWNQNKLREGHCASTRATALPGRVRT
jgi:hypothetical protein